MPTGRIDDDSVTDGVSSEEDYLRDPPIKPSELMPDGCLVSQPHVHDCKEEAQSSVVESSVCVNNA